MDKRLCIATARPGRTKYILKSSYLNWHGLFLWVIFMTIQSVNLTVPGGDTPRSAFTKINANFSNSSHAASREVGVENGNVMAVGAFGLGVQYGVTLTDFNNNIEKTLFFKYSVMTPNAPSNQGGAGINLQDGKENLIRIFGQTTSSSPDLYFQGRTSAGWKSQNKIYHNNNTTLDSNGLLKPSSPVLRVFNDRIEGNNDGDTMAATYTKNGVGDYTISGTTGLRTDGWYITIPNDMNGNPKVAVTLDDTDGVITLKTYARIFDMNTFKFVPDLNQPLDIPDGRWIDLRFNDLPIDDAPAQQPNN